MTDSEQNRLRSELPAIVARLGAATDGLLKAIAAAQRLGWKDLGASRQIWEAREALAMFDRWLRRAAGPSDVAPLEVRQDAEMR